MAKHFTLSDTRYLEILERVVFEGHYFPSQSSYRQNRAIQIFGGRVDKRGLYLKNENGEPIQERAELWEAEQFRIRAGDLQHELGPSEWMDHLTRLNLHTPDLELKRFFARTRYYTHPQDPKAFQIAVRTPDGRLRQFTLERGTTDEFGRNRDLDQTDTLKVCGWPDNYPVDFFVPSTVVTCLRPLDSDVVPTFSVGLGRLLDKNGHSTHFILAWLLDKATLGLVYNYTESLLSDEEVELGDPNYARRLLTGHFPGVEREFSLATLDGDFRLGDGIDPEKELLSQLEADITLYLNTFAYDGFRVEDACRFHGVIQEFSKELMLQAMDETNGSDA